MSSSRTTAPPPRPRFPLFYTAAATKDLEVVEDSSSSDSTTFFPKDQSLPIKIETPGGVPIHLYTHEIETQALDQLHALATSPLPTAYVSALPDVHLGKGVTIGSVFASRDYICPHAVGVDIGCGMAAVPIEHLYAWDLQRTTPDNGTEPLPVLKRIQQQIQKRIPTGFEQRQEALPGNQQVLDEISKRITPTEYLQRQLKQSKKAVTQLGTLGGGNHFLELVYQQDNGQVWVLLHSGSRNIGNRVATHYHNIAKQWMLDNNHPQDPTTQQKLLRQGIHYMPIESKQGQEYLTDMEWCQQYAFQNRRIMKEIMLDIVRQETGKQPMHNHAINIHHNYCTCEDCGEYGKLWVTRKGATSAKDGEFGIIPGSMGTGSYITRGKGNLDSWNSSSHGAGRKMSRTKAHADITQDGFEQAMKGILCDTHPAVKDEAPQAYKDLTQVMANQAALTEIVHHLLPLLNVKGFETKIPKKYQKHKKSNHGKKQNQKKRKQFD